MSSMVKLAVDFENPGELWWQSGGTDLWDALREGFDGSNVIVDQSIADSWLAEAARLPGWQGGPEWAPHPICVKPLDEDEEA